MRNKAGSRTTTITYVLALTVIAMLSVCSYLTIDRIVQRQEETARVMTIAGRQGMLAQRIAMTALELTESHGGVKRAELQRRLQTDIDTMERSHRALTNGSAELAIGAEHSPAIQAIYFAEPYRLDARMTRYLADARAFLAATEAGRTADNLALAARQPLPSGLLALGDQYARDGEASIQHLRRVLLEWAGLMLVTLAAEALLIFRPLFRRLSAAHEALLVAAHTDALTGSMNRRHLLEVGAREFSRTRRYRDQLAVLMFDIDRFKAVNDTYGHAVGDNAIRVLAATVAGNIRESDVFGRLGGEEFALMLPDTTFGDALVVAEKLRNAIAQAVVPGPGVVRVSMTASIGVTAVAADDQSLFDTLTRADHALYQAKHGGRNRVVGLPALAANQAPCRRELAAAQALPAE